MPHRVDRWKGVGFLRWLLVVSIGATGVAAWMVASWANWRDFLPTWAMPPIALLLMAVVVVTGGRVLRSRPERDGLDPFERHRDRPVVRRLTLTTRGDDDTTMTFELARSGDDADAPVVLEFHGVANLRLMQWVGGPMYAGDLRCRDLGDGSADGRRLHVADPANDSVEFVCRAFREVSG